MTTPFKPHGQPPTDANPPAVPLPPIWVLNLKRSPKRRQFMEHQLTSFGLDFEFINAIDGYHLSEKDLAKYSKEQTVKIIGRELSCTEIGCALSHLLVYHRMVREEIDEVLVLEDDIRITQTLLEILKRRDQFPNDYEWISFQTTATKYPIGKRIYGKHRACKFLFPAESLLAYLITRKGAQKLLRYAYPIRMPSDCLTSRKRLTGLVAYGVTPSVTHLTDFVSDIWGTKSERDQHLKSLEKRSWLIRVFLLARFNWFGKSATFEAMRTAR